MVAAFCGLLLSQAIDAQQATQFIALMQKAGSLAREAKWHGAIAAAQAAFEEPVGDFERIDAALLKTRLQRADHDLPGARQTLDVAMGLVQKSGDRDLIQDVQAYAARLALQAKDRRAALAHLHEALAAAHVDPQDWVEQDEGARLLFAPAGLVVPTLDGGFVRTKLQPASRRLGSGTSWLIYQSVADAPAIEASVFLSYRDQPVEPLATQLKDASISLLPEGATDLEGAPLPTQVAAPQLHRMARFLDPGGTQRIGGVWLASQGPWELRLTASWSAEQDAQARPAVGAWLAAIEWPKLATDFQPAGSWFARQQEVDDALSRQNWAAVDRLTAQALPLALFPGERAQMLSAGGIAAYERGADKQADSLLSRAMAGWSYTARGRYDDQLFEQAALRAADLAMRAGDSARGIGLLNQISGRELSGGSLDAQSGALRFADVGVTLPARIGEFLRQSDGNLAYYVRLRPRPRERIGVTLFARSKTADIDGTVAELGKWLDRQQRADVLDVQRQPYAPAQHGGAQAESALFKIDRRGQPAGVLDVTPESDRAVEGERMMGFWIARAGQREVVVRAEWAPGDTAAQSAAATFAAAFPWPSAEPAAVK